MDELFDHIRLKRIACSFARRAFQEAYPAHPLSDAWVRAVEPERTVVAVFYQVGSHRVKPSPYKVFAVARHTNQAEELSYDPISPYWWHN